MINDYIESIGFELEGYIKTSKLQEFENWAIRKYGLFDITDNNPSQMSRLNAYVRAHPDATLRQVGEALHIDNQIIRRHPTAKVDLNGKMTIEWEGTGDPTVRSAPVGYSAQEYTLWSDKLSDLKEFLDKIYEDDGFKPGNGEAAMHLHFKTNPAKISTKDAAAILVLNKEFRDKYIEKYKQHYRGNRLFLGRIENSNSNPNLQDVTAVDALRQRADRHFAINFTSLDKSYGTIELRLPPAPPTAAVAYDSVKFSADTFGDILKDALEAQTSKLREEEIIGRRMANEEANLDKPLSESEKERLKRLGIDYTDNERRRAE